MTADESIYAIDDGELFILNSNSQENLNNTMEYNSDYVDKLSKDQISDIINDTLFENRNYIY